MSLSSQNRRDIRVLKDEGYGGRRIANLLDLSYGKVRRELERYRDEVESTPENSPVPITDAPLVVRVWDIETTNLRADIGRLVVVSFLDAHTGELQTRSYKDFDSGERGLAEWTRSMIERTDMLIGHNTKAFDRNFLNGVLARHGLEPMPQRYHLDTYLIARYGLKGALQSSSLANLADFFRLETSKYQPSKHDWRDVLVEPESLDEIKVRCEEDVRLNLEVWHHLRPYWHLWQARR